ncbi:putative DNA modification/repair radical SAM protein [Finegoldia magna]|uniref:Biotin synthase related domain containing protein n=1 Tax=Finegoldia magna (strain ATCC 29328 / DSM 20472 / WAL 2508) TaxID=334413 RepID=B0RZZ3_FINM2|nr:putative DNA modification/repair radical SAM protein [Finegoldia magna]UEA69506.1 putative DNA modification/repair radical SAM protein [Finegoldia magna]BAG07524.1 biotin synthase related domain containing protein [Finegoldia magna ATCC 29328]
MELKRKLSILSDAAKYDVSCSSSGSNRKNTTNGIGQAHNSGICHSWSEDGRCISLLKILLTNKCIYSCEYCINRKENNVERAEFTPEEVADLTINFYKRNYIEGLFLSSGVVKSPDYTMIKLIRVAEILRNEKKFNGYIHMKAIPGASEELIERLGRLIDRMSINIELPTKSSLKMLAPQKTYESIEKPMSFINESIMQYKIDRKTIRKTPLFLPAGQSTQMIVGAAGESDLTIINKASSLYEDYKLKRVFYSGFVPVIKSKYTEKIKKVPMLREHRLYQADWLMRFYKFKSNEILNEKNPFFDLTLDPKAFWAVQNVANFPIEINRASYEELLRVPGFGPTYAMRIINARKFANLSFDDLTSLKISLKKAKNFILVNGVYRGQKYNTQDDLLEILRMQEGKNITQLSFLE